MRKPMIPHVNEHYRIESTIDEEGSEINNRIQLIKCFRCNFSGRSGLVMHSQTETGFKYVCNNCLSDGRKKLIKFRKAK